MSYLTLYFWQVVQAMSLNQTNRIAHNHLALRVLMVGLVSPRRPYRRTHQAILVPARALSVQLDSRKRLFLLLELLVVTF